MTIGDTAIDQQIGAIEADVRRLVDLEAIYRLRLTYYDHLNENRFAQLPELFTVDAWIDFGNQLGRHEGRDALTSALAGLDSDLFVKVLAHGHVADISGESASGHLFIEGRLIVNGESFITMGKVSDRYTREDGRWLIAQSVTHYYFATPLHVGWADEGALQPFVSP